MIMNLILSHTENLHEIQGFFTDSGLRVCIQTFAVGTVDHLSPEYGDRRTKLGLKQPHRSKLFRLTQWTLIVELTTSLRGHLVQVCFLSRQFILFTSTNQLMPVFPGTMEKQVFPKTSFPEI